MTIILSTCIQIELNWLLFSLLFAFELGYSLSKINNYYIEVIYEQIPQKLSLVNPQCHQSKFDTVVFKQQKDITIIEKIQQKAIENYYQAEEFLKERIILQGNQMHTHGTFQMRLQVDQEKNRWRKIQKHQIITEFQSLNSFNSVLPDTNSVLHLQLYKGHKNNQNTDPFLSKRIINLLDHRQSIEFSRWFCENGKFKKFFHQSKIIGKGGFGTVFSAFNVIQKKRYAIKKIILTNHMNRNQFIKQVQLFSNLNHPNIVRYYTCWMQNSQLNSSFYNNSNYNQQINNQKYEEKKQFTIHESSYQQISYMSSNNSQILFKNQSKSDHSSKINKIQLTQHESNNQNIIVKKQNFNQEFFKNNIMYIYSLFIQMQLYNDGTLATYMANRTTIHHLFAFNVLQQLLDGVQYLHSYNIAHRDLKPANIFMSYSENKIKIGDFGLALFMNEFDQNQFNENKKDKKKIFTKCGTPSYIAPQLLTSNNSNNIKDMRLVDIYAIGVIYYELLNIFETNHERIDKLNQLKEGVVTGIQQYRQQKKMIKLMIKKNRLNISQLRNRKQYLQLKKKYL